MDFGVVGRTFQVEGQNVWKHIGHHESFSFRTGWEAKLGVSG